MLKFFFSFFKILVFTGVVDVVNFTTFVTNTAIKMLRNKKATPKDGLNNYETV